MRHRVTTGTLIGIITYNPDISLLKTLLERVAIQGSEVVVYDNASENIKSIVVVCEKFPCCSIISNKVNIGISGAANAIFRKSVAENKEFVLLFDQDSIPEIDYTEKLISAYRKMDVNGLSIAALGGVQICRFTNDVQPFIQLGKWKPKKVLPEVESNTVAADFLITSGTLMPTKSLKEIGGYDNELFIDSVDVEWCSRAIALGFKIYGVLEARFSHAIGENRAAVLGFPLVKLHAPVRTFYIYRNILILLRRRYVSNSWKANAVVRASLKILFLTIYDKARFEHLKAVLAALRYEKKKKSLGKVNSEALAGLSV